MCDIERGEVSDLSILLGECCALINDVLVYAACRWDKPSGYIAMTNQITDITLFTDSVIQSARLWEEGPQVPLDWFDKMMPRSHWSGFTWMH